MPDPPPFVAQLNLKKDRKRDFSVEERQMILNYGLQNLKRVPNRSDEIGSRLAVLVTRAVKLLSCSRSDANMSTVQLIWNSVLTSYSLEDNCNLPRFPANTGPVIIKNIIPTR